MNEPIQSLNRYRVRFFDGVAWKWRDCSVLASDEAQARAWADRACAPAFREKPVWGSSEPKTDSLEITAEGIESIPYVIEER